METKYFYKIENNIEFVWRIRQIEDDPYRVGDSIAEHFVGNVKQHVNRILKDENDLHQYNFLAGYKKIFTNVFNDENAIYNEILGLLRKDEKFSQIYTYRHVLGLNKIARIQLDNTIEIKSARNLFQKSVNIDNTIGKKIIKTGFEYYKSLWKFDNYFSDPKLNSIVKFKPTIELNSVNIYENIDTELVTYYFRPSWDEEHGMYVRFDFKSMECKVMN